MERNHLRLRFWFALFGITAFSALLAAPTYGTVIVGSFYPQSSGLSFGLQGTTSDDEVRVAFGDHPEPHIVDDPGGVSIYSDCQSVSETSATCSTYIGHYKAQMMDGDDDAVFGGAYDGKFFAGAGNDYVSGSGGNEEIYGSRGKDYLSGGIGSDLIDGGPDPDVLVGGLNDDRIRAADGRPDPRIDCGPGDDDFARIDRKVDPRPWGCERVLKIG